MFSFLTSKSTINLAIPLSRTSELHQTFIPKRVQITERKLQLDGACPMVARQIITAQKKQSPPILVARPIFPTPSRRDGARAPLILLPRPILPAPRGDAFEDRFRIEALRGPFIRKKK